MKTCPKCKQQYEQNMAFCPLDGQQLSVGQGHDDLVGRLIDFKYQIHERIARGGTGSVYRGTHLQLNMPIAVKVMHQESATDLTAVERFRREAYAAMQIRHPNAIAVMDFGVTPDNLVYVVMEYMEGKTLRQRLKDSRYLSLIEINDIIQQICGAVAIAHKFKIIHRDLKPENIFIHHQPNDEAPIVKVLDFGIAKFKEITSEDGIQLTKQGFVVGTPYYMSPEQCYGKEVDARSDIYSLGIMLYELLAGRLPFLGRSHTAVAVKQAREKPRPIYELRANVPAVINAVVMHALEKQPAQRPASVRAFADELDAAMKAVTESEFKKVFLEASEQDLEAAVLLTADPIKIAEQLNASQASRRKKQFVTSSYGSESESQSPELSSTVDTAVDEKAVADNQITGEFDSSDQLNLTDEAEPESAEAAGQNHHELFGHIAKETAMLLQIILADLEASKAIDSVFLSELKSNIDQLRGVIYRLQQSGY